MTARWITAALLLMASPVLGQEEPVLKPGDQVRVTAPTVSEDRFVATYRGFRENGNVVFTDEAVETTFD